MNAMPYVWASCPCDYRIQNLVRLNQNTSTMWEMMNLTEEWQARLEAAVLAEREACAQLVENYTGAWDDQGYALSQAIRARGQE
jgi:hypothetical protein